LSPARLRASGGLLLQKGSLTRRLLLVAALWIAALLGIGGMALERALASFVTSSFDQQLESTLNAMIASAEIGPQGEVRFTRSLGDQRFFEPYSGFYWQVTGAGQKMFRSRSLWDRALPTDLGETAFGPRRETIVLPPSEVLRTMERDAVLPGSSIVFRFQVGQSTLELDRQIRSLRNTLTLSLSVLGLGLIAVAVLQAVYGLWPLRRVRRALNAVRAGEATRVPVNFPPEIAPLVIELNALLDHNEAQAAAARTQAGNLAHALKTPMSVLLGEARASGPDLPDIVIEQVSVMKRHVDHHLARARALGRRAVVTSRAEAWPALEAVAHAVERIHQDRGVVIDMTGDRQAVFAGERQDLEEMIGNLLDNAAKYGGGRVFVTVSVRPPPAPGTAGMVEIVVEDDGPGIPPESRGQLFGRGARLDTDKPGTGLGLAIVRDVAEIYDGSVELGHSEDLGGLAVTLRLPTAA
jgi:signal transduction histidine kinase